MSDLKSPYCLKSFHTLSEEENLFEIRGGD